MSDINIRREHQLGLAKARKLALSWTRSVEQKFGLQSFLVKGKTRDILKFSRAGLDGQIVIAADHFELTATLGLMFGMFKRTIEAEVEKNLDAFLEEAARPAAVAPRPAKPRSPKK